MAIAKKTRANRRRVRKSQVPQPNPLSPFRQGPGKPTLRKDYLFNEREKLLYMLQSSWYALEWNLSHARSLEAVHKAFAINHFNLNSGPLAPLLRESFQQATSKQLQKTYEEMGQANEKSRSAQDKYQAQLHTCNEAARVEFSVSEEAEKNIRGELERRTANISTITEGITAIRSLILNHEFRHKATGIPLPSAETTAFNELLCRLERHKLADERVCVELEARIRLMTPDARKLASENASRQKALLAEAELGHKQASRLADIARDKYLDEEAFIYRSEVLKFLQAKEYRLNALTLANAIAGLPYITARRSAHRCAKIETNVPQFTINDMFQFVKHAWAKCKCKLGPSTAQTFEREIRKLPKFRIVEGHRRANRLRVELAKDWYYLRTTLHDPDLAKLNPGAVPGTIIAIFLTRRSSPESSVTATIAERERISD